jgi:hypothetical protein
MSLLCAELFAELFFGLHTHIVQFKIDLGGKFCSQPPLLSAMVSEIYKRTGDLELARKALPALIKEHEFWNSGIKGNFLFERFNSLDCIHLV